MNTANESVSVQVLPAIFLLKNAIRCAAFLIGSLEAVAAPWFKDPALIISCS